MTPLSDNQQVTMAMLGRFCTVCGRAFGGEVVRRPPPNSRICTGCGLPEITTCKGKENIS
jgi:hypothetical protein